MTTTTSPNAQVLPATPAGVTVEPYSTMHSRDAARTAYRVTGPGAATVPVLVTPDAYGRTWSAWLSDGSRTIAADSASLARVMRSAMAHAARVPAAPEFTLTPVELACNVTIDAVRAARASALILNTGESLSYRRVAVAGNVSPATGKAAARMALGVPCQWLGLDGAGHGIYGPA